MDIWVTQHATAISITKTLYKNINTALKRCYVSTYGVSIIPALDRWSGSDY